MKNIISFAVLFFLLLNFQAEERDSLRQALKVYSLNYKIDVPLTSVGTPLFSLTTLGVDATTQMLPHVLMSYGF